MNNIIDFSETESNYLKIKIGRCNKDYFNENQLEQEITEGNYDVCRLKVSAEDEFAPLRLEKTGMPYFFSGSIRRYKTPIDNSHKTQLKHPTLLFELYDGTQDEALFEMMKQTWGDYPIGYYRSPILRHIVNKEMELNSLFAFYKKNNLSSYNPSNSMILMKDENHYVGFFALNIVQNHLESHVGGILPAYRKSNYFFDMLAYIKNFCIEKKLTHFVFGARNENAAVQKIFHSAGFIPVGSENVFHIVTLFNSSQKAENESDLNRIKESDFIFKSKKYKANEAVLKTTSNYLKIDNKLIFTYKLGKNKNEVVFDSTFSYIP